MRRAIPITIKDALEKEIEWWNKQNKKEEVEE